MKFSRFILTIPLLFIFSFCNSQNEKIDSLRNVLKNKKDDTNKVNSLNLLSTALKKNDQPVLAKQKANEALSLSEKINDKKGSGDALITLGLIYLNEANYSEALKNLFSCLAIRKSLDDKKGIGLCYNNIGIAYKRLGNFPDALKNYFKGLKIREEMNDKNGMAGSYNNIGEVYRMQENYSDALKNYEKSLAIANEINNKMIIAVVYSNIGSVDYATGNFAEALQNFWASLKIRQAINDDHGIGDCYNNIACMYADEAKSLKKTNPKKSDSLFKEALNNHFASLAIRKKMGDQYNMVSSYGNIGNIYLSQGNLVKANEFLNMELDLAKQIGSKDDMKESYEGLSELDSAMGNDRDAFQNYKMYILYRDSLLNEENTKKTVQSQMQYEFDKKTSADSIKNSELKKRTDLKHDEEIKQQKAYTYGGVCGFLLMLVVAGVSLHAYRNKFKANKIISLQKIIVEQKQKEILDSIHYAKRIQQSLLPTEKYIQKSLNKLLFKKQE